MRYLIDECVTPNLARELSASGHDAVHVALVAPSSGDAALVPLAERDGRIIVTQDYDFGELVFRQRLRVPGIICFASEVPRAAKRFDLRTMVERIETLGAMASGKLTVIEFARMRQRNLP
jgi:predicted nuclease of predicted toxin-antitoxin system